MKISLSDIYRDGMNGTSARYVREMILFRANNLGARQEAVARIYLAVVRPASNDTRYQITNGVVVVPRSICVATAPRDGTGSGKFRLADETS